MQRNATNEPAEVKWGEEGFVALQEPSQFMYLTMTDANLQKLF